MLYAFPDIGLVLLVGDGRLHLAHRTESVRVHIVLVHQSLQLVEMVVGGLFCVGRAAVGERHDREPTVEMVEHDDVAEEHIEHVGCVVSLHRLVFHLDVLKIAHGIERCVSIKSATITKLSLDMELRHEMADSLMALVVVCHLVRGDSAIRETAFYPPMADGDAGNGIDADERPAVVLVVIVGTLHEGTLRRGVAQAHVYPHGGVEVAQERPVKSGVAERYHRVVVLRIVHIHLLLTCC